MHTCIGQILYIPLLCTFSDLTRCQSLKPLFKTHTPYGVRTVSKNSRNSPGLYQDVNVPTPDRLVVLLTESVSVSPRCLTVGKEKKKWKATVLKRLSMIGNIKIRSINIVVYLKIWSRKLIVF